VSYLGLCLICIVAVELFIRLPFLKRAAQLTDISRKTTRVIMSSRISDHWKEKALQRYSRDMAVCSLALGFFLAIVFVSVTGIAMLLDILIRPEVSSLNYLMTTEGIFLGTGFALVYAFVRKHFVSV
jgi:hypothetical protein